MAEPTFNAKMVAKLQTLLLANVGAQSVSVDGQSVTYTDLVTQLERFETRLAAEEGRRPRVFQISLGGF